MKSKKSEVLRRPEGYIHWHPTINLSWLALLLLVVLALGATGAEAATRDYPSTILADNPVLYYRLGDPVGSSTVANVGSVGALFNGSVRGGAILGQPGAILTGAANTAIGFDGSSGYVFIPAPDPASFPPIARFSLETWFKAPASWTGTGYAGSLFGVPSGFGLQAGKPFATLVDANGISRGVGVDQTYNDGAWHHMVLTDDGSNLTLYLDGHEAASGSLTGAAISYDGTRAGAIGSNGSSGFFMGLIDEAAAYTYALSPAQVAAHYGAATAAPSEPRAVTVLVGNGWADISWQKPLTTGTSPLVGYTVSASPGDASTTVLADRLSARIDGLTADCHAQYTFSVTAINGVGAGPASQPGGLFRPSGVVAPGHPAVAIILLDGAPSDERGGSYHPVPAGHPDDVTSYCAMQEHAGPVVFPLGLRDNLNKWNTFPYWCPSGSTACTSFGLTTTQDDSFACLRATGDCLTDPFAAQGVVFLPYSYTGAQFDPKDKSESARFIVNGYGDTESASGKHKDHVKNLAKEITSIHRVWKETTIVLIGHSYGGLIAELYWQRPGHGADQGVTHVISLDSPINGVAHSFAAGIKYGQDTQDLFAWLWKHRESNDTKIVAADTDGSYRAIGTKDDPTFAIGDFPQEGLLSQVLFGGFLGGGGPPSPNFTSPCAASDGIDNVTGHGVVKLCPGVISYIKDLVWPNGPQGVTMPR